LNKSLELIDADQARRHLLAVSPLATEHVPLEEAGGRVLAMDQDAAEDLPVAARAVMDGYAVRGQDVARASASNAAVLNVVGQIPMGEIWEGRLEPGEALGISTGGFLPTGADTVVMIEFAREEEAQGQTRVLITKAFPRGANIIQKGEDLSAGEPVITAGHRLRPQDIAGLATFGVAHVPVFRRPKVAIISTGNELCPPHVTPPPGKVRDINQAVLGAEVRATGADVTLGGIVPDDAGALEDRLRDLLLEHDVVILSGGSSVGVKDLAGEVVAKLGSPGVVFHGIHVRPGKPTLFARIGSKIVLGLPGFPTSSMVIFEAFVRPMLARLGGETVSDAWAAPIQAVLSEDVGSVVGREDYVRVRLSPRGNELEAEPLPGGSSAIRNVLRAEGLLRVPASVAIWPRGTRVAVRPF